jgi:hypothetical protein
MPLILTLTEKVNAGLWKASGTFIGKTHGHKDVNFPAEALVRETPEGLILHLDSSIAPSKINDKGIVAYHDVDPVSVEAKKGAKVTFKYFHTTIEK